METEMSDETLTKEQLTHIAQEEPCPWRRWAKEPRSILDENFIKTFAKFFDSHKAESGPGPPIPHLDICLMQCCPLILPEYITFIVSG